MWIGVTSRRESLFVSLSASQLLLGGLLLPSPEITFSPHSSSSGLLATGGVAVKDIVDPMFVGALVLPQRDSFLSTYTHEKSKRSEGCF